MAVAKSADEILPTAADLLTLRQAAEYAPALGDERAVWYQVRRGSIPHVRVGGKVLVVRQDLDALARQRCYGPVLFSNSA
jgi:hypothetical protein